jgi:mono/diheme cytochrome c family protein
MKKTMFVVVALTAMTSIGVASPDAVAGKAAYEKSCKTCHGVAGVANPAIAKMMKIEMKDLGSTEVQGLSNADIKKVITEGKGKMKPVKTLSSDDVDNLVAYVHTFKK